MGDITEENLEVLAKVVEEIKKIVERLTRVEQQRGIFHPISMVHNEKSRWTKEKKDHEEVAPKPPDLPPSKIINSKQVSRTKLFEEGENDEGSESAEKTPEPQSSNTDLKINLENSVDNFPIFLAHEESSSKWNDSNPTSQVEVMNFTSHDSCNISGLDQHALFEAPRSNHENSRCKPACSGILTRKGSFEILNQTKPKSEEEDIQVTSQPDSDFAELDLPALIGDLRADEKELGYKSNYFRILTHQGKSETWNHVNPIFNEGVMDFSNQCNLHLPYLEAHEFGRSQRCDWRPEDFLTQLEASKNTPRCILSHWIIGFQSHSFVHQDLPYLDTRDYNAIQRLLCFSRFDVHEFGSIYTLKRPSIHGYIILISRYKDQDPTVLKKSNEWTRSSH